MIVQLKKAFRRLCLEVTSVFRWGKGARTSLPVRGCHHWHPAGTTATWG